MSRTQSGRRAAVLAAFLVVASFVAPAPGEPTDNAWKLQPGFTAGAIRWPTPEKISLAPLTTYGSEGEVMLLVPLSATSDGRPRVACSDRRTHT